MYISICIYIYVLGTNTACIYIYIYIYTMCVFIYIYIQSDCIYTYIYIHMYHYHVQYPHQISALAMDVLHHRSSSKTTGINPINAQLALQNWPGGAMNPQPGTPFFTSMQLVVVDAQHIRSMVIIRLLLSNYSFYFKQRAV